jgi:hypothetical protein
MVRLHRVDEPSFASDPARLGDPFDPRLNGPWHRHPDA